MKESKLQDLLEYLAKSIVDDPNQVFVDEYRDGKSIQLDLQVGKADIGRVIGKHGRVANSIRALLKVVAARSGKQVTMDVVDLG
ncbi:MAG: KH domain-containing protein [Anaerolineaceae bacterium]|nr:KH domain-containing protein [Anaerolineaceae bacterium]